MRFFVKSGKKLPIALTVQQEEAIGQAKRMLNSLHT